MSNDTKCQMTLSVKLHKMSNETKCQRENSCLFIKTNKFAKNSGQPDNGLRQLVALAQDRLLVPLGKKYISVELESIFRSWCPLGHKGWEKKRRLQEGGLILAQEDVIGGSQAEGWDVGLKLRSWDVGFHKFVQCIQCGMVSGVQESLGWHFETVHFALEMCDVSWEVSIFVCHKVSNDTKFQMTRNVYWYKMSNDTKWQMTLCVKWHKVLSDTKCQMIRNVKLHKMSYDNYC